MSASHLRSKSESQSDLLIGLPPLPYSLHPRKRAIAITWSIILFDSCLLPIIMFYALWFTKLSHTTGKNLVTLEYWSHWHLFYAQFLIFYRRYLDYPLSSSLANACIICAKKTPRAVQLVANEDKSVDFMFPHSTAFCDVRHCSLTAFSGVLPSAFFWLPVR